MVRLARLLLVWMVTSGSEEQTSKLGSFDARSESKVPVLIFQERHGRFDRRSDKAKSRKLQNCYLYIKKTCYCHVPHDLLCLCHST